MTNMDDSELLCTPDDVFNIIGTLDEDSRKRENSRIEQLIKNEPIFQGNGFKRKIKKRGPQAGQIIAHSVALKSGLITDELRFQLITEALKSSDFFKGTYAEIVRIWLNRNWPKIIAAGVAIAGVFVRKGEFSHYDEVKDHLYQIHEKGGEVKVIKGDDERTSLIVKDLHSKNIPVRIATSSEPKIRMYICNNEYLYFVSTPGRIFIGFKGSDQKTLELMKQNYERDWSSAKKPGNIV